MLKDAAAESLMNDAHAMREEAMARLDAGDWRDASEKAWCATRNATQALLLEIYGVDSPRSTNIDAGIRALARERGGQWVAMRKDYTEVVYYLHIEAFYGGVYHDDIPDLVRGVSEYIALAEELTVEPNAL